MSYRNPKAAPINTGAAVYQGIQKLAGDVYTFAKEEQARKGQLISESLAAQQAIDDNVNKMGLSLEEGEDNFEKQIFEQAQAAKQKIAAQYDTMSRTFSSPEQRAKAKAEINKLNKELKKSMESYLEQRNKISSVIDKSFFLITKNGKKLYPSLVYRRVRKYLLMTSSNKVNPHVLRHTFATHMLNNGADLNAIKEILGHANLAATQIYTHSSIKELKSVYNNAHPRA